jgi:hypothetical protein
MVVLTLKSRNRFFVDMQNPKNLGKITNTIGTPRLIQFSLRYSYLNRAAKLESDAG